MAGCVRVKVFSRVEICILGLLSLWTVDAIQTDYLTSSCNSVVTIETSLVLESSLALTYSNAMNCSFTVKVAAGKLIFANFGRFEIEEKVSGSCVDYLNVYDGGSTTLTPLNSEPLCGSTSPGNYTSTGTSMTLLFVTDSSAPRRGFDIVFTAVTLAPCASTSYQCSNQLCIASELVCDNHQQCSNGEDEANCQTAAETTTDYTAVIAGVTVGIAVVIIAVIVGVYIYHRQRWKKFLNQTEDEEDIWDARSSYPITYKYYTGRRGQPDYNTLQEQRENDTNAVQEAMDLSTPDSLLTAKSPSVQT